MKTAASKTISDAEKVIVLERRVESLQQQLDWFQRQLFGRKSEKRLFDDVPEQPLLNGFEVGPAPKGPAPEQDVKGHTRQKHRDDCVTDSGLRFDESVPVTVIELPAPELEGAEADEYEVISEKVTYRLAQRQTAYEILKYVRPVIKHRTTAKLFSPPAPPSLWAGSIADVSVVAGLLVEKLVYHQPLYRQHQRLQRDGVTLSRETLANWVHRAAQLLEPIYQAQLRHILRSKVLSIDETPVKAGQKGKGKMKLGWFWPIYGEADEVAFTFSSSRAHTHLVDTLPEFSGTLLTDGYGAYTRFVKRCGDIEHAQCWAHSRREFIKAQKLETQAADKALDLIGELYLIEADMRARGVTGEDKRAMRQSRTRPGVDAFFAWCNEQCQRMDLVPSNPLSKAIAYVQKRETHLRVFLDNPRVDIDTNHLERTLRVIPMGKKAWLFCWTELGAKYVGVLQSLLTTCRLHGVHPYTYLVDVLQRVARHPNEHVEQLTPRLWAQHFADDPLRSDVERLSPQPVLS